MKISKGYHGWSAESEVKVGERLVRITTMKRSNGMLATMATAGKQEGLFFSFMVFQDFNKVLLQEKARCTEKAVAAQHSLVDLAALTADVEAFYA
jgi:hypothetical protein